MIFYFLIFCRNESIKFAKILLKRIVNINANNDILLRKFVADGKVEIVKLLLEHGADVHVFDDYPLRDSVKNGFIEIVKILLEHSLKIKNICDEYTLKLCQNHTTNDEIKIIIQKYIEQK